MLRIMRLALLLMSAQIAIGQLTGVWEQRSRYPLPATEISGAAINGFVYVVCGLTAQGSTNRLFRYDPRTNSWTELASLPVQGGPTIAMLPEPAASYMYSAQFASAPVLLTGIPGNMIPHGITGRSLDE